MLNRRQFVRIVPALGVFTVPAHQLHAQSGGSASWPAPPPVSGAPQDESFPAQHPFLAREMVGVAHGNLARVKELVTAHPALAKASWDWGFGDWEKGCVHRRLRKNRARHHQARWYETRPDTPGKARILSCGRPSRSYSFRAHGDGYDVGIVRSESRCALHKDSVITESTQRRKDAEIFQIS